jgi:hypothetical protein
MMAIKDHPAIGLKGAVKCKGRDVPVTAIAVRRVPGFIFNRSTIEATNANFIEVKFQPDSGGPAFWSKPMVWKDDAGEERSDGK